MQDAGADGAEPGRAIRIIRHLPQFRAVAYEAGAYPIRIQ